MREGALYFAKGDGVVNIVQANQKVWSHVPEGEEKEASPGLSSGHSLKP